MNVMKTLPIPAIILGLISLSLSGCQTRAEGEQTDHESPQQEVVVTSPKVKDVVLTQKYNCQIHSRRHIELRALVGGYLEEVHIGEGQKVKKGDLLFKIKILPVLDKPRPDAEKAEAELKATDIKAPYDGIVDRPYEMVGSLIEEGDLLTTLSDNSVIWVYFNVPEARYLEYMTSNAQNAGHDAGKDRGPVINQIERDRIELVLANGKKFPQTGKLGAIEAEFNSETGNIRFRADFPNPKGLLRHGQTGTVLLHRTLHNAIVIPQRAMFEILDKQYVFVVDDDNVVRLREIVIQDELEDLFVVKKRRDKTGPGLDGNERIIVEGIRQVRDGDKVECELPEHGR